MDRLCIDKFNGLVLNDKSAKLKAGEWTVLAGVVMHDSRLQKSQVIALATGVKCLPLSKIRNESDRRQLLRDSHAEILSAKPSIMIKIEGSKKCSIVDDISFHLYISQAPCGDASMDQLFGKVYNESEKCNNTVIRGRDDVHVRKRLRTKPGRGDAPPVLSMSCSDKIAKWNVVGFQGGLLSKLLTRPVYFESIVVGDLYDQQALERAILERTKDFDMASKPTFQKSSVMFEYKKAPDLKGSNISYNWIYGLGSEVIVNGRKLGAAADRKTKEYSVKTCSRLSSYSLYNDIKKICSEDFIQKDNEYQRRKEIFFANQHFSSWKLSTSRCSSDIKC